MKLVIDIDEEIYKARQHWVSNPKRMVDELDIAIANGKPQEPCEDAVSRQAVIDILDDMTKDYAKSNDFEKVNGVAWVKVQKLQSVNPQKTGHWISRWYAGNDLHFHVCSECNEEFSCDMETGISIDDYHYCPNCGAKMKGGAE